MKPLAHGQLQRKLQQQHFIGLSLLLLLSLFFRPTAGFASVDDDSTRVLGYIQEAYRLNRTNLDSAFEVIDWAIDSVEAIGNEPLLIRAINVKGILYDIAGNDSAALANYQVANAKAKANADLKMQASIGNNIGLIHWNRGEYLLAIEEYEKSLALFREIEYLPGQANNLNNISLIYAEEKRFDEAIEVLRQSYDLRVQLNDGYGLSAALSNLGFYYSEIDALDSSLYYSRLALIAKDTVGDLRGKAVVYGNLGNAYSKRDDRDSAIWAFSEAVAIDRELGDSVRMVQHLNPLAWQLHLRGDADDAYRYMKECADMAATMGAASEQWEVFYRLGELATEQEDWPTAAMGYERAFSLYNRLRNDEREEQILEFQERFRTAEAQLALAQEQQARTKAELEVQRTNIQLLALGGVLLLMVIAAALLLRGVRRRQRQQQAEQIVKEQLMESGFQKQLTDQRKGISQDLHDNVGSQLSFLSSALQNLSFALQMKEQPGTEVAGRLEEMASVAKESVDDLRSTVWAMNRESLTTREIVTRLEQNIRRLPEGLGGVDVKFQHEGEEHILPQAVGLAIYRMTQEALNNALKYSEAEEILVNVGVSPSAKGVAGQDVSPSTKGDSVAVAVAVIDNGVGFDESTAVKGSGLEGMERRAARHGIQLSLNSEAGKGTHVKMIWNE